MTRNDLPGFQACAVRSGRIRHSFGPVPGPGSALKVGFTVGFIAGFPLNFAQATWSPIDRAFPWGWMMDLWVGSILATLVAGVIYKD